MNYFGARYYASLNGRFATPDDPGYMTLDDPQSWNLYAYAYNNPLRFVDPTGHDGDCIYQYDPKTGHCYIDQGTMQFLLGLGRPLSVAVQSTFDFLTAPRDPGCMAASAKLGSTLGAVGLGTVGAISGGAGGGALGTAGGPGGTLAGGFFGGSAGWAQGTATGAAAGGVVGGAVGSVTCMTASNGGGGGGGGGRDHMTADESSPNTRKGDVPPAVEIQRRLG